MIYSWQHKKWPSFIYNDAVITRQALELASLAGMMEGMMSSLNDKNQQETLIRLMIEEALKTSAIEGELFDRNDVMSSLKNKLGINKRSEAVKDRNAQAVAELMIEVRQDWNKKLSASLLKNWHQILFKNAKHINIGKWRSGTTPMQVVSGSIGKEIIHFEVPPANRVSGNITAFIHWYNDYKVNGDMQHAIIKTAIAHMYFETIHPFEDGNGRIGRALAEKCLAESLGKPMMMSLSFAIEKKRKDYYAALKEVQSSLHINNWLIYFADILVTAQKDAIKMIKFSLQKSNILNKHKTELNVRHLKVLNKMFDAGFDGFKGGMTAKKYISITRTSKATATRDLQYLTTLGILAPSGAGRSAHYELADFNYFRN